MGVIQRSDLITNEAVTWPDEYLKDLDKIIVKSKQLGGGTAKKNISELEKVQRQLSIATDRSTKEFVDQKAALNTLNTTTRNAVKDVQNLDNAYDKLSKELNDTRKAYKNLSAAGKANTKAAKDQLSTIKRLDSQLKKIDNSVGQNQRSVGGYSKAIRGVTARFIGWGAAIFAVGRALKDAFKRIRQYDKSVTELSAILGKTRKELQLIEKEIIRVASASTKTSSEVADLAVALATLGATESEILRLIEPTNNLSIALKASSEESGKLLLSTLNAFGKSANEAGRFGNVIAKLRTTSALDFEGIKDSLGFIAPTARAVGLSIERTGAIIGTLADNGVKASRAGALLNTSFARLATNGLTLDEALTKIAISNDKVATASDLFGKRAFGLALILADNRDKVDELTLSLRNSEGALQDLTNKQLESLDAKLLILDSSWEKLILTMTKGDNLIAKDLKGSISTLSNWFELLSDAIGGTDSSFERWKQSIRETNPEVDKIQFSIENLTDKITEAETIIENTNYTPRLREATKNLESYQEQLTFLNELLEENAANEEAARLSAIKRAEEEARIASDLAKEKARIASEAAKKIRDENINELRIRQIDGIEAAILEQEEIEKWIDAELEAEKQLSDDLKKVEDTRFENTKKALEKEALEKEKERKEEIKRDKEKEEIKTALISQSFDVASELSNRFASLRIEQIQQELTALEFARDRELEQAEGNKQKEAEINAKFDEERKKLQKKQVITEKANALFQIALNTAIGITNALSKVVTAPLVPFIAAMGVIQAAAVIAAPIPEFDEGKDRTPKDYIAGEKRPELRKSKGKWSLVDKPTLFKNSPGDKIVSGKETDSILGSIADLTGNNLLTDQSSLLSLLNNDFKYEKKKSDNLAFILQKNNDDLIRTIKNKKEVSIKVKNAKVVERSGNMTINRMDFYYNR